MSTRSLSICQTDGLTLHLSIESDNRLAVELEGGELRARIGADLDAQQLCKFFSDAATGVAPSWGRWEYKCADDNFVLHAAQDRDEQICLHVNMLASADDSSDWAVDGTILLSVEKFREYSRDVQRLFGLT